MAPSSSFPSPPSAARGRGCYDEKENGLPGGKPRKRDYPFWRWFPFLFAQSRYRIFGFALINSDASSFNLACLALPSCPALFLLAFSCSLVGSEWLGMGEAANITSVSLYLPLCLSPRLRLCYRRGKLSLA